jgi:hypothetical protein
LPTSRRLELSAGGNSGEVDNDGGIDKGIKENTENGQNRPFI